MGRGVPAIAAAIFAAGASAQAQEPVDIELVLAIDMSISVNIAEFLLQRQGFAAAFRDPAVIEAISANAQGVAVSMVAWAGVDQQSTVIDWRLLTNASSSLRFATAIERELIIDPDFSGKTAIGNAISYSLRTLDHNGYSGTRRKIDVSGDGPANEGLKPDRARDYAVHSGVTVNGLAILNDEPYLEDYYRKHVIGGSGAFVMVAADYRDFADAIRRKLLRELSPVETAGRGGTTLAEHPSFAQVKLVQVWDPRGLAPIVDGVQKVVESSSEGRTKGKLQDVGVRYSGDSYPWPPEVGIRFCATVYRNVEKGADDVE